MDGILAFSPPSALLTYGQYARFALGRPSSQPVRPYQDLPGMDGILAFSPPSALRASKASATPRVIAGLTRNLNGRFQDGLPRRLAAARNDRTGTGCRSPRAPRRLAAAHNDQAGTGCRTHVLGKAPAWSLRASKASAAIHPKGRSPRLRVRPTMTRRLSDTSST
jgi:hypothetical protein